MSFCENCGKKLKKGEVCDCNEKVNKIKEVVTSDEVNNICNSFLDILKSIFIKPVSTVKKYSTKKNFILGLIAIFINSFVCGLYLCFSLKKIFGFLIIRPAFFKFFISGFIGMLLFFTMLIILVFFISSTILKDKINIKEVVSMIGVLSIYTTITMFLCLVLNFISISFSLILVFASILVFDLLLYNMLMLKTKIDQNKIVYVVMPSLAVATMIAYLVIKSAIF